MKHHFFFILLLFPILGFTQTKIDTTFYSDGKIYEIFEMDSVSREKNGTYQKFDSLGNLKEQSFYFYSKAIECVDCYERIRNYEKETYFFKKYDNAKHINSILIEQKIFYSNGKLAFVNKFAPKIREYVGQAQVIDSMNDSTNLIVTDGYYSIEQLKHGQCKEYYKSGIIKKITEYRNGRIIHQEKFEDSEYNLNLDFD